MRTSIHIPDDLLAKAKKRALAEGRTLTSLIEEGLRTVLAARHDKPATERRKMPRVSAATGGLLPGIDPARIDLAVDEADDLDWLRRGGRG